MQGKLTCREKEVLVLRARGYTRPEIAEYFIGLIGLFIGLLGLFPLAGCNNDNYTGRDLGYNEKVTAVDQKYDDQQCKIIINSYFQALKEKDLEKIKGLFSSQANKSKNMLIGEEYEYIKVISIVADDRTVQRYMTYGRGRFNKAAAVKGFVVKYLYKLKNSPEVIRIDEGKSPYHFILIKEKGDSSWKIDGFGY